MEETMNEDDWKAQEPPDDFADRVMDRVRPKRTLHGRRAVAVVALVLAAAALLWMNRPFDASSRGEAIAATRQDVQIGRRARAVLEPGARVAWEGDRVTQTSGDVFYRVEASPLGQAFRVLTPEGEVEVVGTCFRVRVEGVEVAMKRHEAKAAALGAALGAVVLVTVYEGTVVLSHGAERTTLAAGESARASAAGVARGAESDDSLLAANANLADAVREYKRRLDVIETRRAAVEKQLEAAEKKLALAGVDGQAAPFKSEYDLSQDDWKELAKKGQARALFPCPDPDSWAPSSKIRAAFGLTSEDEKRFREAAQHSAERVWAAIRPLCIDALEGNARIADKLGPRNCQTFVLDQKVEHDDEAIRAVAEIRAGLKPAPSALGGYEQMLYTMSGESKAMEQELAQSFGPDMAHRMVFGEDTELCSLDFAASSPAR
jgi:hypothetical protein